MYNSSRNLPVFVHLTLLIQNYLGERTILSYTYCNDLHRVWRKLKFLRPLLV